MKKRHENILTSTNSAPTSELLIVYCSCSADEAAALSQALVERHLAACVQALPKVTSTYRWQGKVTSEQETLLLIKSTTAKYAELSAAITELHSYELPEIIAVPVSHGLPAYLEWVMTQTSA